MADNILITPGTGATIAADDIGGGVLAQRIKPVFGPDGTGTDVSSTSGLPIQGAQATATTVNWTSATSANTASTISVVGYSTVVVAMSNTSTMTAGVLTFEVSPDNTNWFPVTLTRIDSHTEENSYTLSTVSNKAWSASVAGFTNFRVRLSTAITGSGTATVTIIPQAFAADSIVTIGQATAANLNATVTGTLAVTESGTWTVQPGNTANSTPWLTTDTPSTSGGLSAATGSVGATATSIKSSAGQLYGWHLFNTTAAVAYVQFFNLATGSVTLGTTAPLFSIGIPASGGATVNFDKGIAFGTAITFACTTTRAGSTGATCDVNFFYK